MSKMMKFMNLSLPDLVSEVDSEIETWVTVFKSIVVN